MKRIPFYIVMLIVSTSVLSGCGKADNYYNEGRKLLKNGSYDKAAQNFASAIAINQNQADYYIDYGMALIKLGQYEDALSQFDQAYMAKDLLIIRGNNKKTFRGKGIAYYYMQQYEDAARQFQLALEIGELSGLDMDILYYMADSYQTMGMYQEAVEAYTSIIRMDDKNAAAYGKRAFSYKSWGNYEQSLADYDSAVALEPKNYEYYLGKYYLMAEQGDDAGAAAVLDQAEAITAKTDEDQYNLAKVHLFRENYEQALSELSESHAKGFQEANYYIGELYRMKKDYEKAAYYYDIYISSGEAAAPNVFNQMAICRMKLGDYKEALDYLEQGLAYRGAGILKTLRKNEIIAYEYLGRYEDAKKKMDAYLEDYPEDEAAKTEAEFILSRIQADPVTEVTE